MANQTTIIQTLPPSHWDRYVRRHPSSTHFHLHGWKKVIENTYGHRTFYLSATALGRDKDTRVRGILPLVHLNHFIGGNRLVSLPFVDAAGILADSRKIEKALLEKAIDLGRELKADYLELRHAHAPGLPEVLDSIDVHEFCSCKGCRHRVFRHKVDLGMPLPGSSKELMGSFPSKLRSQIRKAMKNGLCAEIGGIELIPPFFEVFARNMRDLGSPVHSRRLFENLMGTFSHDTRIVIVRKQGTPVAGSLVIRYRDALKNPWASSLRKYRPLSPNMLLYWAMLEHACNTGLSRFDFGRSTKGAGTHRFKCQWGAVGRPLSWHCFLLGDPPGEPVKESLCLNWWKQVPVFLSKHIGPAVRKHISL